MDSAAKFKRERSSNFSLKERDILISLITKHKSVIESKESDAATWKCKDATWSLIEQEFNARIDGPCRSSKSLRIKYEGLKRMVRKKAALMRAGHCRTGVPLDSAEEQIKHLISLSPDGMEGYESDVSPLYSTQTSHDDLSIVKMEDFSDVQTASPDPLQDEMKSGNHDINCTSTEFVTTATTKPKKWDVASRHRMKSRRHPALMVSKKSNLDELNKAKLELVHLQKSILEAEIIEKKKEWEFKDMERKWKEEEYKLKLEKLRRELKD